MLQESKVSDRNHRAMPDKYMPNGTEGVAIVAIIGVPAALLDFDDDGQRFERD